MPKKTRGETEAAFTREIIRIEKEFLGRGSHEVRTFFLDEMIIVHLRGILPPAENKLSESVEGQSLIKETRRKLFEAARPLLEQAVTDIVNCGVISKVSSIGKTGCNASRQQSLVHTREILLAFCSY